MADDPRWFEPDWTCPVCLFNNKSIRLRCRNCSAAKPEIPIRVDLDEQAELDGVTYERFEEDKHDC